MLREKTFDKTYDDCIAKGFLCNTNKVDIDKIKMSLEIADEQKNSSIDDILKKRWNSGYDSLYDCLHILIEAFLIFDKVKSLNHQCLFVYLCQKNPELELDWYFFERIRMRRNGINYYGKLVSESVWKEDSLQFELYISLLRKEVLKRLNE